MKRVVINFNFPEEFVDQLKEKYTELDFRHCLDPKSLGENLAQAEILISFIDFSRDILDAAPKLKWIQSVAAGVDFMDLDEIARRGILLTNGRGIHKIHMSEYAIAAMINLARNLHLTFRNQVQGLWDRTAPQGEINGATLGIIGLGDIGKEIARKATFLGMRVIGVKRSPGPVADVEAVYGQEDMTVVFEQSDYIINLLPAGTATEKIIDTTCFSRMKKTACFINIGRGKTVNEPDLIQALSKGNIRAAVSDVFFDEPLTPDSPIWHLENIIITPHVCGVSNRYMERGLRIIDHNLNAYLRGQKDLINVVDLAAGY